MGAKKRILFLGVGGAGMAPLAMWLAEKGESIFGYDDYFKQYSLDYLMKSEVSLLDTVFIEDINSYDQIVYSNAIPQTHRLLKEAERLKIPCLKRGEMLAQLAESKKLIAIVGSHGKTTTSALIGYAIGQLDLPVNFIMGGFYQDATLPYRVCDSEWLLAEIDESDGTINGFNPEITVLLNLDWDHMDFYKDFESLKKVFEDLLLRTRSKILIEASNFEAFASREAFPKERLFMDTQSVDNGGALNVFGESENNLSDTEFNRYNRVFAEGVLGLFDKSVLGRADLFKAFPGVERRQKVLLSEAGLMVLEDYAHHPSEIDILIKAVKAKFINRELTVIFQPHRHSRTKALNQDFVESLSSADNVCLLPVYSAFENECEGGMTNDLVSAFGDSGARVLSFNKAGLDQLLSYTSKNKERILLFIGAGTINEFAHAFCGIYENPDKRNAWLKYTEKKVSSDCLLKLSENLAGKTTFKIGGMSKYYAEPSNTSDVLALIKSAQLFGLPYFCLGRGSNVLVSDAGYNGLVIRFNHKNWRKIQKIDESHLWVGCGVRLKELCGTVAQLGFSGFEFLEGIPGTLGGALRMNAGAMGQWTFDVVERVLMVNADLEVVELGRDAFTIEYRKVPEIAEGVALGAVLKLGDVQASESIRERMDSYSDVRKGSQPIAPSAGCIFKNPDKNFAGRLIDELGLKKMSVGGAEVSDKHGNFIVNRGGSTSEDVQSLIALIQKRVKEERGIDLEPEVLLLGDESPKVVDDGGGSASGNS